MTKLTDLKVKLFTDDAEKVRILEMARQPWIKGFTTNPSLLKTAGLKDYEACARDLVAAVPALGTRTAAELSLDALKAFRADALAVGLTLPAAPLRAAE